MMIYDMTSIFPLDLTLSRFSGSNLLLNYVHKTGIWIHKAYMRVHIYKGIGKAERSIFISYHHQQSFQ
jgi:hypothetical protein